MINNSRILRNTIMLYIRMFLMMFISLYTSRIVLQVLGVVDYGIYNIVGSVVVMFSFLNMTFTVTIRRFLSIALTNKDKTKFETVLHSCIVAVLITSFLLFLIIETIGLWFLNTEINIPIERISAANWVFQISLLTFILNTCIVPLNAAIISCEHINFYAYLGVGESILKLGLIILLSQIKNLNIDLLIIYSLMILIIYLFIWGANLIYCNYKIIKLKLPLSINWIDIKSVFNFSIWSILGTLVYMISTQGVNIIMNIFFGVTLNAAIGIAQQVNNAFNQFIGNFQTAFNPTLTKSYASEGLSCDTLKLVYNTSRMSFLLISILSIPLILNIDLILNLWLVNPPTLASQFVIIFIIYSAIEGSSGSLFILVYAHGKIKKYQLLLSLIQIVYVLFVYILCILNYSPTLILSLNIINGLALCIVRLIILKQLITFPIKIYFKTVYLKAIFPITSIIILTYIYSNCFTNSIHHDWIQLISSIIITIFFMLFFYLSQNERLYLLNILKKKFYAKN